MQIGQVLKSADLLRNFFEPILRHIKADKITQISNLGRQPLQLIVVQPKLLKRWQITEMRR